MTTPILEIKDLFKTYSEKKNPVFAVDGVSFDIKAGEIFSLLGVNGAGKTTLSSIIATLHPPTSGDVLFKGTSIYKDLSTYRSALGFCPQRPNLDPFLSVEDNLIFAGRYFLMPHDRSIARAKELMQQFGLTKYASFNINELSGGYKQRLSIARALVHKPEIVILDEPTVGLDPSIRRQLWDVIKNLKQEGVTVILTTHYLDEAEVLSDRACIMHRGKVLLIDTLDAIRAKYKKERLEDIFIEITGHTEELEHE